jgi:hypothetical protein
VFSLWNMLAYGAGIVLGMWLDRFMTKSTTEFLVPGGSRPDTLVS